MAIFNNSDGGKSVGSQNADDTFNFTIDEQQKHFYADGIYEPGDGYNPLVGGNDTFNLDFSTYNQNTDQGHHIWSGGGSDTFNFTGLTAVTGTVTGRIDDFDASRDVITVEGAVIDLYDPPSNVKIFEYNGDHNDAGAVPQLWMAIEGGPGGVVYYALEGARLDLNGDGQSQTNNSNTWKAEERHFVNASNLPAWDEIVEVQFIDPHNTIPDGETPADPNGLEIVDIDKDGGEGSWRNAPDGYFLQFINTTVSGSSNGDLIAAGLHDDTVEAGGGDDKVWGGSGNDQIDGGSGNDYIAGNRGNDTLTGGSGADVFVFEGAYGEDVVTDFNRNQAGEVIDLAAVYEITDWQDLKDNHLSEDGNDVIIDDGNGNTIRLEDVHFNPLNEDNFVFVHEQAGGNGADTLTGTYARDALFGGAGDDVLDGGAGTDILEGGAGDDALTGGAHSDTFVFDGNFGNDTITDFDAGTDGDLIDLTGAAGIDDFADLQANHLTDPGADVLITDDNGNTITIESTFSAHITADDFIFAAAPAPNVITGTSSGETLNGTADDDVIFGLGGNDKLYGGAGDDYLVAGEGWDKLYGGAGSDTFHFETYDDERSQIHDFEVGVDTISIDVSSTGISNYSDLMNVMQDGGYQGNHSFVKDANGDWLFFLVNLNTTDLSAGDFEFV